MTRKPARRLTADQREATSAKSFGERIHCDCVGPTEESMNGEKNLLCTRDEASGFPSVAPLKRKTAEEVAEKFVELYRPGEVKGVRTDNGPEFDGAFHAALVSRDVRHERSLPFRPTSNSRAERWHRTLEEGMRCSFVQSMLPYVFWPLVAIHWCYVYARSFKRPTGVTPYMFRYGRDFQRDRLKPMGCRCFFLAAKEERAKFASTGCEGVLLGHGRLQSYVVLDFELYVKTKGNIRVLQTRDVKFPAVTSFPFVQLGVEDKNTEQWIKKLFTAEGSKLDSGDGTCIICGLFLPNCKMTCPACRKWTHRTHSYDKTCELMRCKGHATEIIDEDDGDDDDGGDNGGDKPPGTSAWPDTIDRPDVATNPRDGDGPAGGGSSSGSSGGANQPVATTTLQGEGASNPVSSPVHPGTESTAQDAGASSSSQGGAPPPTPSHKGGEIEFFDFSSEGAASNSPSFLDTPEGCDPYFDAKDKRGAEDDDSPLSVDRPHAIRRTDNDVFTLQFEDETVDVHDPTASSSGQGCAAHVPADDNAEHTSLAKALVTNVLDRHDPEFYGDAAEQAIAKEMTKMKETKTFNTAQVKEWNEVKISDPEAEVFGAKLLLSRKHAELEPSKWEITARLVGLGHAVRDTTGKVIKNTEDFFMTPASLFCLRLMLFYTLITNAVCTRSDVRGAYLNAPLGGAAKYLRLPKRLWPKSWFSMRDPVVRIHRALYGLQRSGFDWDEWFEAILAQKGWKRLAVTGSCIFVRGLCLLLYYVDDLLIAGPGGQAEAATNELAAIFTLVISGMVSEFLGIQAEWGTRIGGVKVLYLHQTQYAQTLCARFLKLTGVKGFRSQCVPMTKSDATKPDDDEAGRFADFCRSFIGALLYLTRGTRPDIAYAVSFLGRFVTNWLRKHDRMMLHLFEYVHHTASLGLVFTTHPDEWTTGWLEMYCDADLAGCPLTRRSTMGFVLVFVRGKTHTLSSRLELPTFTERLSQHGRSRDHEFGRLCRQLWPACVGLLERDRAQSCQDDLL